MNENAHIFDEIPAHVDHRKSVEWNQKHAGEVDDGARVENPWMHVERLRKELAECRTKLNKEKGRLDAH